MAPKAITQKMDLREVTFKAHAVLSYADSQTDGPPLVLLHGGSARWQSWEEIIPNLARRWHVLAPDLRGHGRSSRAASYRLRDYASDIAAFLQGVVKAPAVIFGHSLGGMIALCVAAQHAELARALIVGDSPLGIKTRQDLVRDSRDRLIAWRDLAGGHVPVDEVIEALKMSPMEVPGRDAPATMREVLGDDSGFFPLMAESLYHNDPAMLTAVLNEFDTPDEERDLLALLPRIRCPVLLIQADPALDGLLTPDDLDQAMSLLAQPTSVRTTGLGHALHHRQPEQVLRVIRPFLDSL